jgi:hypothetical protein
MDVEVLIMKIAIKLWKLLRFLLPKTINAN